MNIFILDDDIKKSAEFLMDKHVVKMVLEHCQLLCSPYENGEAPYKRTHYNHPCAIWLRESQQNYEWLMLYTEEMFKEYTKRYSKIHKSSRVLKWCRENYRNLYLPDIGHVTPFKQAMPDEYKNDNPVIAYRNYYMGDKRHIATWKTNIPHWWK